MRIKHLLREPLKTFEAYRPGGKVIEVDEDVEEIINLNANENQLGPSFLAIKAMQEAVKESNYYPFTFGQLEKARKEVGEFLGFSQDHIMITSGSSGIISAFGEIFLNPGDEVITCVPTYDSYRAMVNRYGAIYKTAPLKNHTFDLEAMQKMINEKTKLIIIVNPNNPTGTIISNKDLDNFIEKVPDHVITVIDEAYFEWINQEDYESAMKYVKENKNVVVLKTFSKLYGMAGVRIGYGVMKPEICNEMRNVEFGYGASRIGIAGMLAALKDHEYVKKSIENNTKGRTFLTKSLKEVGFEVVESYASFVYFLPKGIAQEELIEKMGRRGVLIRGYGQYARVSVGVPHQNEKFVETLKNIMGQMNI